MKKYKIIVALLVVVTLAACNKETKTEGLLKPENLQIESLTDKESVIKLSSSFYSFTNSIKQIDQSIILNDVDFGKAFISSEKGQMGKGIGVILNSKNRNIIYTFMLSTNGSQIGFPTLVAIENRNSIKYYDLTTNNLLHLIVNENVKVIKSAKSSLLPQMRIDDCGQATQDCITDAYSNHGWTSIWLGIQSAFIPQTAVAIAAACAAKNCL
jgi:hypothetical protein